MYWLYVARVFSRGATEGLLGEAARSFPHFRLSQCQPASRWIHCWPRPTLVSSSSGSTSGIIELGTGRDWEFSLAAGERS